MGDENFAGLSRELAELLGLTATPIAISFTNSEEPPAPPLTGPMPRAADDGRQGRVAAGCVFWMRAVKSTFTTVAEDHENCSVGSLTHGLMTLEEVAGKTDIAALMETGWVRQNDLAGLPSIAPRPRYITYGPLAAHPVAPDVVLIRLDAAQVMRLRGACPNLRFEGKPQCHIIPLAHGGDEIAVSVGCVVSRQRTGMADTEMTCAFPGRRLGEIVGQLRRAAATDAKAAGFARDDMRRFAGGGKTP